MLTVDKPEGFPDLTPALFRMLREHMGISVRRMAEALGVTTMTIARWESGHDVDPSPEAWIYVFSCLQSFNALVDEDEDAIMEGLKPARVTYYRSQAQYDASHDDGQAVDEVNARMRELFLRLYDAGLTVSVEYPVEG